MIIIRRPAEQYHQNSLYNEYDNLCYLLKLISKFENDLLYSKEHVCDCIYNSISRMSNKNIINHTIEMKRKAFKKLDYIYDISNLNLKKDEKEFLLRDLDNRKRYIACKKDLLEKQKNLEDMMSNKIIGMCNDYKFMNRVKTANYPFYKILSTIGKPIRKSHYITLLKYIYKQETCCTPSSLWSGVALYDDNIKYGNAIFADYNKTRIKYEYKKQIIDILKEEKDFSKVKVYLNPTILYKDSYYLMVQFSLGNAKKIRFKNNNLIETLLKNVKNKIISINDLKKQFPEFELNIILELINIDVLKVVSPFPYGESGLKQITIYNNKYDNYNARYNNIEFNREIKKDLLTDIKNAFSIYKQIYDAFFKDNYFGKDYIKLKEYLYNSGKQNLLEFLYSDFSFLIMGSNHPKKIRNWSCSRKHESNYMKFCEIIKAKCNDVERGIPVKISILDISTVLEKQKDSEKLEVIFQYDEKNNIVIPEMLSLTVGRFEGRYGKLFLESVDEIYKEILDVNSIQVNVEANTSKDNISYDNPFCKERMYLYDLDEKIIKESDCLYSLEDIFIDLKNDEIILCTLDGRKINVNCASTLSPGNSKIYQLLSYLTNLDSNNSPLGGTAKTRLELNLDYQPRIIIDNLLISRERWRFSNEQSLLKIFKKEDIPKVLEWIKINQLPSEFYVYTDLYVKPYYCRLGTSYDISIFHQIIIKSERYFYIEEVYPNYKTNEEITKYNMEVLCNIIVN